MMPALRLAAAAALSVLAAAPAAAQPAQVVVQVWSYGYAPRPLHLAAGRPVTLTFVNQSDKSHDFVAPGFFQHAKITGGAMPMSMAMIDLRPGERKSVTLIPERGTYQAHCSHFFHKQLGMADTIIVD
jgi:plastocyanin